MCPNKHLDNWFECDMLSITKADFLHEYEIKISGSDFKTDFKKIAKHLVLEGETTLTLDSADPRIGQLRRTDFRKRKIITEGDTKRYQFDFSHLMSPNYFWYVTPKGLLKEEEIPDYAGWIEVRTESNGRVYVSEKKQPKRLHRNKVTDKTKLRIMDSMMYRYWQLKLK